MENKIDLNSEYKKWLADIKSRVRTAQIKAVVQVNTELLNLYWGLGADIIKKQLTSKWGDGLILQLSKDLMKEFPDMKGFSLSNLKYIKQWHLFYCAGGFENHWRKPVDEKTAYNKQSFFR